MADRADASFARAGARRRPRAWAAPLARPAARIAVAGGLTLAGWLLGAALSQANASADDHADRPAVSAHDTDPEHRYAGTATSGTLTWAMPGAATSAKHAHQHRFEVSADDYRPDASFRPGTGAGCEPAPQSPDYRASTADTRPAAKITKPGKAKSPGKAKHHAPVAVPEASTASTQPSLLSSTSSASSAPGQSLSGASSNPAPSTTTSAPQPSPVSSNPAPSQPTSPAPSLLGSVTSNPAPSLLNITSSNPAPSLLSTTSHEPEHGLLDGLLGGSDRESGPGLLGGLLGSTETNQPGLLDSILGTVDDTVDRALHTTVTSVDTVIDTAPVRVVAPPVEKVDPAPVESGPVSALVPMAKLAKESAAPVVAMLSEQAPVAYTAPARVLAAQPAVKQETQPAPPVKELSQAGGGGSGGGEGLPSAPAAPAAPASTVAPGHDGSGGLRQLFALAGDGNTLTQLKLIGVSRDHDVDGAGRDAALPTTSPD